MQTHLTAQIVYLSLQSLGQICFQLTDTYRFILNSQAYIMLCTCSEKKFYPDYTNISISRCPWSLKRGELDILTTCFSSSTSKPVQASSWWCNRNRRWFPGYGLVGRYQYFGGILCLRLKPWRRRQHVSPKRRYLPSNPHNVTTQNNIENFTATRTSDPILLMPLLQAQSQ
jgi:hypothetical protein